jgi:hypothetical protein
VPSDLGRDRNERGAVRHGVCDAEQQVDGTGAERGRDKASLARDSPIHLGHERGGLLVPGQYVTDARPVQRHRGADVLLARNTEDELDTLILQAPHEQFSRGHRLMSRRTPAVVRAS